MAVVLFDLQSNLIVSLVLLLALLRVRVHETSFKKESL